MPGLTDVTRTQGQGYVVYLRVRPCAGEHLPDGEAWKTGETRDGEAAWLDVCYRLTERVERVAAESAFLDLGACTEGEALAAVRRLLCRLRLAGWHVHAGIGPSLPLAQLVARSAGTQRPRATLALITPDAADGFLRAVPVALLPRVHPAGTVSAEIVERLRRFGLPTLGHLARVGAPALRRQFGAALGDVLARLARGEAVRPLQVTPPPARCTLRVRLTEPLPPSRLSDILTRVAARLAAVLRRRGQLTQEVGVAVMWEGGGQQNACRHLLRPTDAPRLLAQEVQRLLDTLSGTRGSGGEGGGGVNAVAGLRVLLRDLVRAQPEQTTLWRVREQRLARLETVEDTLAHRHGRPMLHRPQLAAPDVVFREERYALAPLVALDTASDMAPHVAPERAPVAVTRQHANAWRDVSLRLHWW
jgi:hypothetical protein